MEKTPEMELFLKKMREQFGIQEADFSKLDYWVGNNQRSDFEEYLQIKQAQERLEMSSKLNSADGLADGIDSLLALLNKEKGNDEFLEHISQSLPKHDYWERYNEHDTTMNTDDLTEANLPADSEEQAEESTIDFEVEQDTTEAITDDKSDIFDDVLENLNDVEEGDQNESGIYEDYLENVDDVTKGDQNESGIYEDYLENVDDVTKGDQNESGIYEDYLENADEIVKKENPSDSGYDDYTHDLKP